MDQTKEASKPVQKPAAPAKDKVRAAFEAIVKDAKTRPGDYVKAAKVPGGGE